MNIFGSKIKTEYEYKYIQYEYYSFFERHRIIWFLNTFGLNYLNIFEYRIISSPLFQLLLYFIELELLYSTTLEGKHIEEGEVF